MYDVECPYCGEELEINHDDGYGYEEDEIYEQECSKCEKTFAYTTSIMYYHDAHKADCLNGAEHRYKSVRHYPKIYPNWVRCEDCGDEVKGEVDNDAFYKSIGKSNDSKSDAKV